MKEKDTKTQNKKAEGAAEAKNGKKQSKGVRIVKIILNSVINIMIVAVLIISILVAVLAITSKNSANGLPNIFGYTLQYVETNSMSTPSPDGYEGGEFTDKDVIIGRIYSLDDPVDLDVGDIITFNSRTETDEQGNPRRITHRIVQKEELSDNYYAFQTWGDNRDIAEVPDQDSVEEYVRDVDIVAYNYTDDYHGATLKGFAGFLRTLRSQTGFFGFILVPMIIFFFYAIIRVVLSTLNYKKSKTEEEKENAEKEKQEAVQAAVAAVLAAQQNAEKTVPADKKDDKPAEDEKKDDKKSDDKSEAPDADTTADKPAEKAAAAPEMSAEELEQFRQFQEFQKMQKAQQDAKEDK